MAVIEFVLVILGEPPIVLPVKCFFALEVTSASKGCNDFFRDLPFGVLVFLEIPPSAKGCDVELLRVCPAV
jgi:hypothetical protein